jgi:hypothetical protein
MDFLTCVKALVIMGDAETVAAYVQQATKDNLSRKNSNDQ